MKIKKYFIPLTSVLLCCSLIFFAMSASLGDVDNNGKITLSDARLALRYAARLTSLTPEQAAAADINSDGKVTLTDARILLRVAARLDNISNYDKSDSSPTTTTEPMTSDTPEIKLTAPQIYEKSKLYTLKIQTYDPQGKSESTGSGFFINSNGWVVTNYHVIADAYSAECYDYTGKLIKLNEVVAYSKLKDIAILSSSEKPQYYASVGSGYRTGDTVYSLGSPLGLDLTFTQGLISQASRSFSELKDGISYIQTTVPISVGSSGCPLINEQAQVIGICTMSYQSAQNLNFAIPVSEINSLDTKNPLTFGAFYSIVHSTFMPDEDFTGIMLPSASSVKLTKGATQAVYVIGMANGDYTINYSLTNNSAFSVLRGGTYGNVTMLYISAAQDDASGDLKLWFDKAPDKTKIIRLSSAKSSDITDYAGIKGSVPDFGAMCAAAPAAVRDSTDNDGNYYAFYYSVRQIENAGLNKQTALESYSQLMENSSFNVTYSNENESRYSFSAPSGSLSVYAAEEIRDGESYICILIKY